MRKQGEFGKIKEKNLCEIKKTDDYGYEYRGADRNMPKLPWENLQIHVCASKL